MLLKPLWHSWYCRASISVAVGWSGRCCRHSALHLGKWETTAGSIQQQQEFILQTKPAQNRHESNWHTKPNIHSASEPQESKQTLQVSSTCIKIDQTSSKVNRWMCRCQCCLGTGHLRAITRYFIDMRNIVVQNEGEASSPGLDYL